LDKVTDMVKAGIWASGGTLMAAARLDLPTIVVTGGYMQLNRYRGEELEPLDVAPKHFAHFKDGRIAESVFCQIQERGCQGVGACPVMGTANTMAAMVEALGLSLPGNACTPGNDSRLMRIAFQAGKQIMALLNGGIRCSDILSFEAFENAIRLLMALGGSTNAVLHLQAVARELELDIRPEIFSRLSEETPFLCDISPSGAPEHHMGHLDEAGGITAVMKELESLLSTRVMTATGESLGHTLQSASGGDGTIICSRKNPISPDGGLVFLTGNLAPDGALVKKSAVPEAMRHHKGPARVYRDEGAACQALADGEIKPGQVVVVRYVGPKGDPGMLLLQRFLWQLAAKGMHDKVAFVTDGRFSGTNKGCAVAHVAPEAVAGGPLAVVQDGDLVEIDIPNKKLNLLIPEGELLKRTESWQPPKKRVRKGFLSIYAKMANSPDKGAALDYGS
jgi:dihydroxy-acid dehydratase